MSQANATAILLKSKDTYILPSILHQVGPIVGDCTFHTLISVVAGITAILTIILVLVMVSRHLAHYSVRNKQRQIVQILLTPLISGGFSSIALWLYSAAAYLLSVAQLYEVFDLVEMSLLFLRIFRLPKVS